MYSDHESTWLVVFCVVVVVLLCLGGLRWMAYDCEVRAEGLGMAHRWNPAVGCFVEVEPGVYAAVDTVRWLPGVGPSVIPGD